MEQVQRNQKTEGTQVRKLVSWFFDGPHPNKKWLIVFRLMGWSWSLYTRKDVVHSFLAYKDYQSMAGRTLVAHIRWTPTSVVCPYRVMGHWKTLKPAPFCIAWKTAPCDIIRRDEKHWIQLPAVAPEILCLVVVRRKRQGTESPELRHGAGFSVFFVVLLHCNDMLRRYGPTLYVREFSLDGCYTPWAPHLKNKLTMYVSPSWPWTLTSSTLQGIKYLFS